MRPVRLVACALLVAAGLCAGPAAAQERHAVVVLGAPGGAPYEETYAGWGAALRSGLVERLGFDPARIRMLWHGAPDPAARSTGENVRRAFADLRRVVGRDDLVLVVLVGHGTLDAASAKFNLLGPDLDAAEWAALVQGLPARVIFVNSTGASFPFLERLSSPNRVVITATDSEAQRFDTVFPAVLVKAFDDEAVDADKNGRLSIWELFAYVSAGVAQHYEQRGQLATERALLDDNGDGIGQESGAPGRDGAMARTTYLDPDPAGAVADPVIAELLARQRDLEARAEALKLRKGSMPAAQWASEFETLMIELARVSRAIRSRS